jgi:large subunit ribosomal protein L13
MMVMIYIDASGQVLGRLASIVAGHLMSGEGVAVVNAEKATVIGSPDSTVASYKQKRARGDPYHGPFYPKHADGIFRRAVRGMLPYKTSRGREAFKRLRVFISLPDDMRDKEFKEVKGAANRGERKCITLAELAEKL